jgi:hypothetical protein
MTSKGAGGLVSRRDSPWRLVIPRIAEMLSLGAAIGLGGCGFDKREPVADASGAAPAAGTMSIAPSRDARPATGASSPVGESDRAPAPIDLGPATTEAAGDEVMGRLRFTDVVAESGIHFVHTSGMTSEKHVPTANGSGVAIVDYDNDGKLDLYFANATFLPAGSRPTGPNQLYHSMGPGRFRAATERSGLGFGGFCHGVLAGDIDNDGDQDLFLCNYGPNALFLNNGDGTFRDISKAAGIDRPNWTSSGAFLDYDNDGDLDLYLANYGDWKLPEDDVFCGDKEKGVRVYCQPKWIRPVKHILYRNNGDLTFTDVIDAARIGRTDGHGFGVVAADLNDDGLIDLYVANDKDPNFLFLNRGGQFEDVTMTSGAGLNEQGQAQAGMGVDAEDVDGDGLPELFVTNFAGEYNTLYQNLGQESFLDVTTLKGLAADSIPWVGWGCALADFDNDGWPDCFVANAHIDDNRHLLGEESSYAQPPLLYRNLQGRTFRRVHRGAGSYFSSRHLGHGAAFGDIDDDGDIDIVVNHKDGPPALLRNDTPPDNRWIRLALVGTRSNRDAIGARVSVLAGGRTIHRQRKGGGSLMSSHDPRLLIGLGAAKTMTGVTIRWPSGAISVLENLATNATYRIVEPSVGPPMTRGPGPTGRSVQSDRRRGAK